MPTGFKTYIRMNQLVMVNTAQPYQRKALLLTTMVTMALLLMMWLLKWKLPAYERSVPMSGVQVEVNWPPDPPEDFQEGGGGGGNPVQAAGPAGVAPTVPLPPGETADSRAIEEDPNSSSPAIAKSVSSKPKAKELKVNSSHKEPIKNIETPAPPKPRALMGKSVSGSGNGGGTADDFDRTGGQGSGWGAGQGTGSGGGSGNGIGGGTGSGTGTGVGPRVTSGDRKIVRTYAFEGDLSKATVYANILVSPDGTGKLISIAKGSSNTGTAYKQAITRYLERMKFDASDHESMVTVQFNFRVN